MEVVPLIDEILSDANLARARDFLLAKHDGCGVDGVRLSQLDEYLRLNWENVKQEIYQGTYTPGRVQEVDILNRKGKTRTISKLNTIDRLVLRMIMQVLAPQVDPTFYRYSFAFREGMGVVDAVRQSAKFINMGLPYVVELDVEHCFDNIPHDILERHLHALGLDEMLLNLILKFLKCKIVKEYEIVLKTKGLVQGSPLSPLLCNIYLNDFDLFAKDSRFHFCRYGDDIKIFCSTYEEGLQAYKSAAEFLAQSLHLTVNDQKSGVFAALDRIYLGYQFTKQPDGSIEIHRLQKLIRSQLRSWQTTALFKEDQNYHIIGDGILTKKDYSLLFENPDSTRILPVECVESLNIHASVTFSSDFFSYISQQRLAVNMFDKYGNYLGAFIPAYYEKSSYLLLQQTRMYLDDSKRLTLVKNIQLAAIHNLRENLKYYRKKSILIEETIAKLTAGMDEIKAAKDIGGLMLIEARLREAYYACFNDIMDDADFEYIKRTRRPPKDAINALISFGNTILYQRIATEIHKTNLDIRIGFLHAASFRRESLNLDIAELFKPVVVDRTIFTLVNKEILSETRHFESLDDGAVYLNRTGKRIFIAELESKLQQRLKLDDRYFSYEELIRRELYRLSAHLEGKGEYKPYQYFL